MDKPSITKIWADALKITKEQYQLDYSGYVPKGIKGGMRILNPKGDEAIRDTTLEDERDLAELLTILPPWAVGDDAPQIYVLDNEPDWVALYTENAEGDATHVPVDDPISVGMPSYVHIHIKGCPVRCIPERNPDIADEEGDMGWIHVPLEAIAVIFDIGV